MSALLKNIFLLPNFHRKGKDFSWGGVLSYNRKEWELYKKKAAKGPKILIATSTGGHKAVTSIESLLAVTLTLRGAEVHFLLCDKFLPACLQATTTSFKDEEEFPKHGPQKSLCDSCFKTGYEMYKPLQLPIHLYSGLISKDEEVSAYTLSNNITLNNVKSFTLDGLKVGEHAYAGALRYFARADLENEKFGEQVLRRYFHASLLTMYVTQRLLSQYQFECVVFNHGIYVPQGITGEVARKKGVRVVNWNPAYRKKCFIFSHTDTYHHTLLNEPTKNWENIKWTKKLEKKTLNYLKSRWKGTQDWIWFHEKPQFKFKQIKKELGIRDDKPIIGMLTNVMWDAQLHYPANAFSSMLEWIIETIRYFKKRKDLQLVIRVHPAEIRGTLPSRQKVVDEIRKAFPDLPKNIILIPPESNVSTYAVMGRCNAVLIYGTKTGVELASMGMPVIVAGEAWVRNKGITLDAISQKHYFQLLAKLPMKQKMTKIQVEWARKYAYHFFFRRMIPIQSVEPQKGWPPYKLNLDSLSQLQKGNDNGLDTICEGILSGKEFIYPAEKLIV